MSEHEPLTDDELAEYKVQLGDYRCAPREARLTDWQVGRLLATVEHERERADRLEKAFLDLAAARGKADSGE